MAAKTDGTAWAWGWNALGQVGDGTTTDRLSPVQVSGLTSITGVAGGIAHSLARKSDGSAWAWGYNITGQLGQNNTTNSSTPVQVKGPGGSGTLSNVTAVAAGDYHSLALKSDGTVWAWGANNVGQLGDTTTTTQLAPVQVSGLTGITAIGAGNYHSFAVKSDGTLWAWGINNTSQLGTTTTQTCDTPLYACSKSPLQVTASGFTNVQQVSAGQVFSMARTSDGAVWTWGLGSNGQLGDGSAPGTLRTTPDKIPTPEALTIASGTGHNLAKALATSTQSTTYGYDRLSRLTSVDAPASAEDTTYTYDPLGNRLTKVRGATTTYAYDHADRLKTTGSSSNYTVDANGNLTVRGSDTLAYDQANRLKTATVSSKVTTYDYDGLGRRTKKTYDGTVTSYVSDMSGGLSMLLEDGGRKYVYGRGLAYTVQTVGGVEVLQVYHTDGLGSSRAVTGASGAVEQVYRTDEFGVSLETAGRLTQPMQYTGEERDEDGLVFLRARYYDPGLGRFVGRDELPGSPRTPATLQRYAYARNNPPNLVDPTGTEPCENTTLTGCAIITTLAASLMAQSGCRTRWHIETRVLPPSGAFINEDCGEPARTVLRRLNASAFTLDSHVFSTGPVEGDLLRHEMAHVAQYDILGDLFLLAYGVDPSSPKLLEQLADAMAKTNFYAPREPTPIAK